MNLSVIICTHNPREDYLRRVLEGLKAQTLPKEQWELLLIDNASAEPLRFNLDWHPVANVIRVEEPGKVAALLRGVVECRGHTLVIVDDDNVLNSDYLEAANRIGREWPILGAWGGSIVAEFEEAPPNWAQPYLRYLAIREVTRDQWSNLDDPKHFGLLPWGAGMCVRREVAKQWAARTANHSLLRKLDRMGKILACGEDTHMALIACDLGLGTGLFPSLRLTHLIPAVRVREPYLLKLMEGQVYSLHVLSALRGKPPSKPSRPRWIWGHVAALRRGFREFRFYRASMRGARAASREIASWSKDVSPKATTQPAGPVGGAHDSLSSP
jgi:hypothetical protein